jgi:hypothetical protein
MIVWQTAIAKEFIKSTATIHHASEKSFVGGENIGVRINRIWQTICTRLMSIMYERLLELKRGTDSMNIAYSAVGTEGILMTANCQDTISGPTLRS